MPGFPCAICGRPTWYEGRLPGRYPFCSARCQWIDLGRWLHEEYTLDRDVTPDPLNVPPAQSPPQPPDAPE